MPFIGNQPALSYTSFAKQEFTTSATTSYTLDNPVANANEIALFINFVRQEPTTAYTASGTSLTLTSATSASDDMYCVFLGKAVQTVNPPSGSVGLSQLSATGTKDATTFLRGDNTFASAGGSNTPAFHAQGSSDQTLSSGSATKILFQTEFYDSNSKFASSTFTPGEAGKFFIFANSRFNADNGASGTQQYEIRIYKNGSQYQPASMLNGIYDVTAQIITCNVSGIVESSNTTDYFEVYGYADGANRVVYQSRSFGAYKIIE